MNGEQERKVQVRLKNINKIYPGGNQAVFDFNLDIYDKDFIVLVGPSGCGKSTTLRMVAGLEEITSGELYIDGELMNEVPAKARGIAMVFQSYALYPHMSVYDNMAFGLKLRKLPKDEIKKRILDAAKILGLDAYLERKPKDLSGGQRQRVALGRAIVREAKVFLFDEPLSNLDAKLRGQMRTEIARIHKNIGATSIYVTHDQIEAMTMATRIVVMRDGYIQQIGTPEEIYENPANVFVGGFIGTPPMNFIKGLVLENGHFVTENKEADLEIPESKFAILKEKGFIDKNIILGIRPGEMHFDEAGLNKFSKSILEISVLAYEMLGHESNVHFQIEEQSLIGIINSKIKLEEGSKVKIGIDLENCHFFDGETENKIC